MRLLPIGVLAVALIVGHVGAEPAAQAGKSVKLEKAGLLQEITNSQKRVMVPPTGQAFLWIMATDSQVQTIDLTKVSVTSGGATSSSLFGVDGTHDGDPTRFAMIAPAQLKGAALDKPLEESWSVGSIAFAFTPGKTATLKIIQPPQSFCLLFSVPRAFQTGLVKGLGAEDLKVPAIPTGK
jgi:hypothetical protein